MSSVAGLYHNVASSFLNKPSPKNQKSSSYLQTNDNSNPNAILKEQKLEDPQSVSLAELFENMNLKEENQIEENVDQPSPFEELDLQIDYVESSQNYQGNYNNYVYRTLKSIIPLRSLNYTNVVEQKKVFLPINSAAEATSAKFRKTLILDLDETLIHADFNGQFTGHDQIITFKSEDEDISVPIFIRPGVQEFLSKISKNFEIFIFTASKKEYADAVLNYLDPENNYFKQRFYRENCISVKNKVFIKDLRIFSNRKPEDIVMVDNSLYSFANQISNGVLINSFFDDKDDKELFNLMNYLENYMLNITDTRIINEKVFNFSSLIEEVKNCTS